MKWLKTTYNTNIYSYLFIRIALVMVLFSFSRICFIYLNQDLLKMTGDQIYRAMIGGMKFDISGILYVNLLFIFLCIIPWDYRHNKIYQSTLHWVFVIFNAFGLASNMGDIHYFPMTLRRTTVAVFQEFQNEARLGGGLGDAVFQYLPSFLIWLAMVILLYTISKRLVSNQPIFKTWYLNTILGIIAGAIIIGLSIAGIRGGFRHSTRPITLSNASKYVDQPIHRAAVLNTPFAIIRTMGNKPIPRIDFYKDQIALAQMYNPEKQATTWDSSFRYDNVFLIVLESFGREHIGALNKNVAGYTGFTPFLDSLIDHSYVFERGFTNGRKSIDALPAIISGIPKLDKPFVLSHYSNNDIESLGSLLQPKGYTSAFFHGAPNGSMGLDAYARQAQFDHYYGMTEYGNDEDFDGLWGLWDEPFFQYTAHQLDTLQEPFVGTLFSLSSHHPFAVPEQYQDVFPKGNIPLQEPIGYTDYALRRFFDTAKKMSWFEKTLFVITCDHAAGTDLDNYKTMTGFFAAPMILFHPADNQLRGRDSTTVVQQIDIVPTVLSYLNFNEPYLSFGSNMLDKGDDHFAFNGTNGVFQLIEGEYSIQHDGEQLLGLYNYIKDPLMVRNLKDKEFEEKEYLIQKFKAVYQQICNRMIDNELVLR